VSDVAAANPLNDLFRRLRTSLAWVAAQFWATLLLILAGVAWTRLPDSYAWQVGLTLFAATACCLPRLCSSRREPCAGSSMMRSGACLCGWAYSLSWSGPRSHGLAWALLDWCRDQIPEWAGYLNSRASAHLRATDFYLRAHSKLAHVSSMGFSLDRVAGEGDSLGAGLCSMGLASAVAKDCIRLMLNWRWWLAVIVAALVGRRVAQPFLHRRAAWNGNASGLVRHAQARGSVSAGGGLLGSSSGVVRSAVVPARAQHKLQPDEDSLVPASVGPSPLNEDSVKLPLPEAGDDSGGNI
jgi:hypothetical protein